MITLDSMELYYALLLFIMFWFILPSLLLASVYLMNTWLSEEQPLGEKSAQIGKINFNTGMAVGIIAIVFAWFEFLPWSLRIMVFALPAIMSVLQVILLTRCVKITIESKNPLGGKATVFAIYAMTLIPLIVIGFFAIRYFSI